jgi:hypothetical protein
LKGSDSCLAAVLDDIRAGNTLFNLIFVSKCVEYTRGGRYAVYVNKIFWSLILFLPSTYLDNVSNAHLKIIPYFRLLL